MSRRAAVLGHPISHSKSPALHCAAYAKLGVDIDYSAIDVTVERLPSFMESLRGDDAWCGLSVTMPLKSAMVKEVDEVRGAGAHLGVINTVVFEHDAGQVRRVGYNTDVAGIVEAVRYAGVVAAPHAAILGGGGTSAAAVAAAQQLGAHHVDVFVRDAGRAGDARAAAAAVGISLAVRPLTEAASAVAGTDLVISTFPPRAADSLAEELAALPGSGAGVLLDVAYDPWPSRLAEVWQRHGGAVVPGLEMLMYQAAEQIRRFSGCDVDAAVIDVMCDSVGLPRRVF
ncbi:shikimate dehydrogenase [Arthrobacter sp. TS-15]|uniref:shikimate dehydrogenase n=1 Tax=Micrococcaceae TaxID=1268 RepID=UPI00115ED467|nr:MULTISPECIES: shikimate dehydrogenase [Micrococcaceae]MCM0617700.1 shikimate dehydrogenase [Paenarthrobacter sp. TYUT067]TQS91747.1 shikimate dehydrogenase [Arthrobacter sp. TS-15]